MSRNNAETEQLLAKLSESISDTVVRRLTSESHFAQTKEISSIVEQTVKQTLIELGVDSHNPIEMQLDFQHLRTWRKTSEDIKKKSMWLMVSFFLAGLLSLVVLGLKSWFK